MLSVISTSFPSQETISLHLKKWNLSSLQIGTANAIEENKFMSKHKRQL